MKKYAAKPLRVLISLALIVLSSFAVNLSSVSASDFTVVSGPDGINTDGQCQLSEAIVNVNDQAQTNPDCPAGDGVDDTITLPSGTITLTADLPDLTRSVKVIGSGKTSTTIDADGFMGFNGDFASVDTGVHDFVFEDFKIINADFAAFLLFKPKSVTMENLVVNDSGAGALISGSLVDVKNSEFNSNESTFDLSSLGLPLGSLAGLSIFSLAYSSSDNLELNISDTMVNSNSATQAGITINVLPNSTSGLAASASLSISRTSVMGNSGSKVAGLAIFEDGGPTATLGMDLKIDSVTVANNSVVVESANPLTGGITNSSPYSSGMGVIGKLSSTQTFTNLTATNNSTTNLFDDQPTISGFTAVLSSDGEDLSIINATITNNSVTQTQNGDIFDNGVAAGNNIGFYAIKLNLSNFDIFGGATAQNSIVAGNSRNGTIGSCVVLDKALYGLSGTVDLTPTNLGGNITDDPNCGTYRLEPNIMATLGPLQDNGGPVQTIALLPGSPAIGAAVQVLGITVDARGIARPSSPDVGAFQTVLASNSGGATNNSGSNSSTNANGTLPETGINSLQPSVGFSLLMFGALIVFFERRNRRIKA